MYTLLHQDSTSDLDPEKMATRTITLVVVILASSSRFGALFSQNAKLLLVEHGTPLVFALLDLGRGVGHISCVWIWCRE
jgi:hypothetical protein